MIFFGYEASNETCGYIGLICVPYAVDYVFKSKQFLFGFSHVKSSYIVNAYCKHVQVLGVRFASMQVLPAPSPDTISLVYIGSKSKHMCA